MANRTIIARNLTPSDIYLKNLGINIPGSDQEVLTDFADTFAIQDDSELRSRVVADDILLTLDGQNLDKDGSLDYLTPTSLQDGYLGFFDQSNILYVGKHGDDDNDGYTIDKAYLTFNAALTAASASSPSESNRFAVVCMDDGYYDEHISVDAYVDVFAPNAILVSTTPGNTITVSTDTRIEFREAQCLSSGSYLAVKTDVAGVGPQLHIGLVRLGPGAYGFINMATTVPGDWCITCEKLEVRNGIAIGDSTIPNGDTNLDIEQIEILHASGYGIVQVGTGVIAGRIGQIIGSGQAIWATSGYVDLSVGVIDCATAYVIGANATLTLFANRLTGTTSSPGTAKVTIAGEAPEHADAHISNGMDLIDGDRLNIDFTPSFYSTDTSPSEVDDGYELTAHLSGIDGYLGTLEGLFGLWKIDSSVSDTIKPMWDGYALRLYHPDGVQYLRIERGGGNASLTVGGSDAQALYFNCKKVQTQLGGHTSSEQFAISDDFDGPLLEVYADNTSRFYGDLDVDGYFQSGDNLLVADDGISEVAINGDLEVHPDAGGINGHRHYTASSSDPSSPSPSDGDRYWNTALQMEMRYDGYRSKWLSEETTTFQAGRNLGTLAGSYYRGINGLILSASLGYDAFHNGTIIGIGYTRSNTNSATFEVTANGSTIASLASSAVAGKTNSVDGDFNEDDILAVRNAAGGNQTNDVQIWIRVKWRA